MSEKININENEKNYCTGHRERLRKRYLENGIDSLMEHEIIELLLFYCLPRVDTKPLAHRLIDEYGSARNLFAASFESLKKSGLSDKAALFIKFHSDIEAWMDRNARAGEILDDYGKEGLFAVREFDNVATEKLIMFMLDKHDKVLGIKVVCEGGFSNTAVNMRSIAEACLERKAGKVILAHNHPSGDIRPSADDYIATSSIDAFLSSVGIELVEHFVVADGTFFGIKKHGKS